MVLSIEPFSPPPPVLGGSIDPPPQQVENPPPPVSSSLFPEMTKPEATVPMQRGPSEGVLRTCVAPTRSARGRGMGGAGLHTPVISHSHSASSTYWYSSSFGSRLHPAVRVGTPMMKFSFQTGWRLLKMVSVLPVDPRATVRLRRPRGRWGGGAGMQSKGRGLKGRPRSG